MLEWLTRHRGWADLAITAIKAVLLMSSFALPAWAANASDWMRQWGPISWVVAGFVGLLVGQISMLLHAFWKRYKIVSIIAEKQAAKTDQINPLDDTFRKQRIRPTDLAEHITNEIKNKVFVDCEIFGPANAVFMAHCHFQSNGGALCDGVVFSGQVKPHTGLHIIGCTFQSCRFYYITFMVPEVLAEDFRQHNWNGINWITSQHVATKRELELLKSDQAEEDVPRKIPVP